ncbi:hypothetical protein MN608_03108 [Microdochium nivale]|nr:hypothetical protein MN608_03108 [Microdochium nivale]
MPTQGVIMRMLTTTDAASSPLQAPENNILVPGVQAIYNLAATDGLQPSLNTMYFLSDVDLVLQDPSYFEADVTATTSSSPSSTSGATSLAWIVTSYIGGRNDGSGVQAPSQVPPSLASKGGYLPPIGTVIVANGSSPQTDKEDDYHAWYEEEHAGGLTAVPGWQITRRYRFINKYERHFAAPAEGSTKQKDVENAKFYGVNFYDEDNGLGGPIWKASTLTDWTAKIRQQAEKPNIRRTWRIVERRNVD